MAGETDDVTELIMLPSTSNYRAALSFKEDGKDYLVPLRQELKIRYDKNTGDFYYDDVELDLLDIEAARKADLTTTDLWPLRIMYSIIGTSLIDEFNNGTINPKNVIEHSVKVRVPDLVGALCSKGNIKADIQKQSDAEVTVQMAHQLLLDLGEKLQDDSVSDSDKKRVLQAMVEKVELFPERLENGRYVKGITFKFPVMLERENT